jgi:pyridinium-3,5-bisthiocarboxylic acid mononucleotide nickel chelatase
VSRQLVFDCFSGIAGDMTIAALLDAGAPLEAVIRGLQQLDLPAFQLSTRRVRRGGIEACHLQVEIAEERTYQPEEMRQKVRQANLPPRVTERALGTIDWLERGERMAHGTETAHFHEVGGVDALIDITGTMLALEALEVEAAFCPSVTVGSGTVARTSHGVIPAAPGPAASHVLQEAGFALRFVESTHELVTPTGAAILAAIAQPGPALVTPGGHGYGAGTFDPPGRPNALRVFLGTAVAEAGLAPARGVMLLEANIDDMPAALLAHARDRLMEEGALDAWLEPIGMKKGRSASKLCALVATGEEGRFAAVFLRETTTLGVRTTRYQRYEAERRIETVETSFGPVRMKVRQFEGRARWSPEFEDVKAIAARTGLPAIEVQRQLEAETGRREEGGGGG